MADCPCVGCGRELYTDKLRELTEFAHKLGLAFELVDCDKCIEAHVQVWDPDTADRGCHQ